MIKEAILLVSDTFLVRGKGGAKYKLHECCFDMEAYCKLNEEYIMQSIMNCDLFIESLPVDVAQKWIKAQVIMKKVNRENIWPLVGHARFKPNKFDVSFSVFFFIRQKGVKFCL